MSDTPTAISAENIAPASLPAPTSAAPTPAPESAPAPASPDSASPGTTDAKGTPFDPARHVPRLHPRTGRWMPRGGRKPGVTPPASPPPGESPAGAPAPSYIPEEEPPPPANEDAKAGESATPAVDHSDDAGEVVCSSIEVIAGIVFDAPEDCTPAPAEHKNMVRAVAAYIRAKGWQATAGVGILLMFGAYLLRVLRKPKPNATVRRWVGLDKAAEKARDVTPADARPAAPHSPAPQQRAEVIELPAHIPPLAR